MEIARGEGLRELRSVDRAGMDGLLNLISNSRARGESGDCICYPRERAMCAAVHCSCA